VIQLTWIAVLQQSVFSLYILNSGVAQMADAINPTAIILLGSGLSGPAAANTIALLGQVGQSSSRMRVIYHNWSATKQRPHPQSVAEISPTSTHL